MRDLAPFAKRAGTRDSSGQRRRWIGSQQEVRARAEDKSPSMLVVASRPATVRGEIATVAVGVGRDVAGTEAADRGSAGTVTAAPTTAPTPIHSANWARVDFAASAAIELAATAP